MKDLVPPPARSLPARRRQQVKELLESEPPARHSLGRRLRDPLLAAAAAGVLTVGGVYVYQQAGDDGDGAPDPAPAADPTVPSPPPTQRTPTPTDEPSSAPARTRVLSDPQPAYDRCFTVVRRSHSIDVAGLRGRLAVSDGRTTTVVVSDGTDVYTCNIQPDQAASRPSPDRPVEAPTAETFAFALNEAGNFGASFDGEQLTWAGGRLPAGATSLTYVFPDGHQADAVVEEGYWVMQDLAPTWHEGTGETVMVEIGSGAGSRSVRVPVVAANMCNQVTHGC